MFDSFKHATLVRRINRFVASVIIDGTETLVYVPNTGRMSELAIPGAECLLTISNGKFNYRILYIIRNGFPVMIDSTMSNSLFADLIQNMKIPGDGLFTLEKREPVFGKHRFDYLLKEKDVFCYAELKSCTLFHGPVASFPDAISERASKHIAALSTTGNGRLFLFILNESSEIFIPNYHTDFNFYLALKSSINRIKVSAFKIKYDDDLNITSLFPVPVFIPDAYRSGFYFAVIATPGNYYIYLSTSCDDVHVAIKKSGEPARQFLNLQNIYKKIKISYIPILGFSPDHDNVCRIFSLNGGILMDKKEKGGIFFSFSHDPAESGWFWDYILELRFSHYVPVRP